MTAPTPITCPRCGGTQVTAGRQGFGVGKAIVGGLTLGPLGLLGGNINRTRVTVTCLRCGHSWTAGQPDAPSITDRARALNSAPVSLKRVAGLVLVSVLIIAAVTAIVVGAVMFGG